MTTRGSDIESIIFDLDGVLVDVANSYRRAILKSIERVHGVEVDRDDIQRLKDAGGFNNDWDVTYALALLGLSERKSESFDRSAWFRSIESGPGGIRGARAAVEDLLSSADVENILEQWKRDDLRRTFQELYLGSELYRDLEDGSPELDADGYINEEPVILDQSVRKTLENKYSLGVLTGRPRAEAEIALSRVGLELAEDHLMAMEDWDESKPDPRGLMELNEILGSHSCVYIGDTLDDIRTAVQAESVDRERTYFALGVLSGGLTGESGRKKYMNEGATDVLDTVNELPNWLDNG
jgi:HAD superfamily hydrolase (TIGR01548 family)